MHIHYNKSIVATLMKIKAKVLMITLPLFYEGGGNCVLSFPRNNSPIKSDLFAIFGFHTR